MHIAINCRSFLNRNYTGIGRYTYHLVHSLCAIDHENQYSLYVKKGLLNISKRVPKIPSQNFTVKIDRFKRGLQKCLGKVDVYHSPSPEPLGINNGAKIIVTVHDLIFKTFPQGHTQKTIDDTEAQMQGLVNTASKFICCSQNTAHDLQKYFQVPQEKIALVYQGVDKNIFYLIGQEEERAAEHFIHSKGVHTPYILFVGTIEPRKNLENLLYAFDKLKTRKLFQGKLAVIGMKGWMSEGIENLIKKLDLESDVIFLGYLSDTGLRYFYNKAQALAFPSFYEGFGFPIVEAFCCGTPVVTSNVSSCPEVAMDAALTVDPAHPEEIAQALTQIIHDDHLRKELREKGFKRAGDFNFLKTAQRTLEVYREVYGK